MIILAPLAQITDNPFQSRTEYGDIADLAADIARHYPTRPDSYGLQQVPSGRVVADDGLMVPPAGLEPAEWLANEHGRFILRPGWVVELEYGHRRLRAFRHLFQAVHAKWNVMPVNVLDLDDTAMLDGVWSENSARRNLSAVEEAELLQKKLAMVASQRELAEAWGISRPLVANRLRLLTLPADIQQANRDGRLSERQALALAPILEVIEKAKKSFNDGSWWYSDKPDKYIEKIVHKGLEASSDDIREYASRAVKHAGDQIPGRIGKLDCTDAPGADKLVQAESCKGCPQRIQDYCLVKKCLRAKLRHFGRVQAQAAAEKLGLPYSDGWDMEDNDTFTNYQGWKHESDRKELAALYQGGGCAHLVVGWNLSGYGVRPLYDGDDIIQWISEADGYNGGNPLAGAVLGHVGGHGDCLAAKDIEVAGAAADESVPSEALQDTWDKDDSKQKKVITNVVKETMIEIVSEAAYGADGLIALMALAAWPGWKADDDRQDINLLARRLVSHLIERGGGVLNGYRAIDFYRNALPLLDAVNVNGRDILEQAFGSRAEALNARARRILYHWLHTRRWANLDALQGYAAEFQALRDIYAEIGPVHDVEANEELLPWLEAAAMDVGRRIAEAAASSDE